MRCGAMLTIWLASLSLWHVRLHNQKWHLTDRRERVRCCNICSSAYVPLVLRAGGVTVSQLNTKCANVLSPKQLRKQILAGCRNLCPHFLRHYMSFVWVGLPSALQPDLTDLAGCCSHGGEVLLRVQRKSQPSADLWGCDSQLQPLQRTLYAACVVPKDIRTKMLGWFTTRLIPPCSPDLYQGGVMDLCTGSTMYPGRQYQDGSWQRLQTSIDRQCNG